MQEEVAEEITALSNDYYEIIPTTQYRSEVLPAICSRHDYQNKKKTLIDLMYGEIVSKLLLSAQLRIKEINPVDYYYKSLSFKMLRLDTSAEEYKLIRKYIKRGTHQMKRNFISSIYCVERKDERENIKNWDEYGNKILLWHGTKKENLVGIMQTGFRIAPPSASSSGSMFGEGVYFADQF